MVWESHLQARKEVEFRTTRMLQRFEETRHPNFSSVSALSRGILKRIEKKQRDHTFHSGYFEHKTLIPNRSLCKSAQSLRSSCKTSEEFVNTETLKSVNSQERSIHVSGTEDEMIFRILFFFTSGTWNPMEERSFTKLIQTWMMDLQESHHLAENIHVLEEK